MTLAYQETCPELGYANSAMSSEVFMFPFALIHDLFTLT